MAVLSARLRPATRHWIGVLAGITSAAIVLSACTSSSNKKDDSSAPVTPSASTSLSVSPSTTSSTGAAPSSSGAPSSTKAPSSSTSRSGIDVTVPARPMITKSPIPLRSTATVIAKVTARVVSAQSVRTQAHGPGEVSGPGVRLVLELTNGTNATIGLDQTVVNVTDQDGNPASPITSNATPFQGSVAAHRSARGVYEFTLPSAHTTKVNVELSYSASAPTVVFSGSIS